MELTLRDWMVIVGVLLILAVLLDAGRRILRERRAEVRLKLSRSDQRELDPEDLGISSPRVVPRHSPPPEGLRVGRGAAQAEPASAPAAGEMHPRDQSASEAAAQAMAASAARREGAASAEPSSSDGDPAEAAGEAVASPEPAPARERGFRRGRRRDAAPPRREPVLSAASVDPEAASDVDPAPPEPENLDWLDALDAAPASPEPAAAAAVPPRDVEPEVFMLNVVSRRPEGFAGEDILHILLACDLRFGEMSFFHRHEQEAGRGPIQFSVANMLKPGVFDIDNMADFRTQGLTFFLTLPGPQNMMRAFDYMLETAQTVARNLDGDVLDETRSALTRQTLEHHRQRIRELERRLLLAQPPR
ncbi:cell division protein ZipA [Haliea atlantica]|nr:cell division protein ZipA [Haliea sp.]